MQEHPFRWVILAGCWLLYFVFGLSVAGLAPLVSVIQADLELNSSAMGTILGAWQFIYIFSAIPVGLALQRYGSSRLLILGGAIIALSGVLRAHSETYTLLLWSVALFGLGGPIISAGIPQTVSRWFSGKERGFAMGLYITGPAIAGVVAYSSTQALLMPLLGGQWRSVLMVWALAAAAATLIWGLISILGNRVLIASTDDQAAGQTQRLNAQLIVDLLRQRNVVVLLAVGAGVLTIDHGLRNWLPEIIRSAGWSVEAAGHLSVISVVMGIVGALSFPRLATQHRRLAILRGLFLLSAAGCLLISSGHVFMLVVGLGCTGLASGALMTITILSLIEERSVGPDHAGLAGGMFFSVAEIGGVSGPVVIGMVHDASGHFQPALWLLAALACILVITTSLLKREG